MRSYTELRQYLTFQERFNYLRLDGKVGSQTFGFDRYLNQQLYHSVEWRHVRDAVIVRDLGCDLGDPNHPIGGQIIIHHMNPITAMQIEHSDPIVFDPEYLITTCLKTHNAIHYGDEGLLPKAPIERRPYDTCPWRKQTLKEERSDG